MYVRNFVLNFIEDLLVVLGHNMLSHTHCLMHINKNIKTIYSIQKIDFNKYKILLYVPVIKLLLQHNNKK